MLISTPLINGYEVADLQPDRSLVRNFLKEGIDVYMINWGYPKRTDRFNDIDDYITDFMDDIVDHVIEGARLDKTQPFRHLHGRHDGHLLLGAQPREGA